VGVVESSPKRGKATSIRGYFRYLSSDIVVCGAALTLAVAAIAGASAARRPPVAVGPARPLPLVQIVGSVDLLTDFGVRQELRKTLGLNVTATQLGAGEIISRSPFRRYKADYLPNQIETQRLQHKLAGLDLANETFPIFRSRLVVATYLPIANLLRALGVASSLRNGIGTLDLAKYVAMVNKGVTWEQIPGNKNGKVYASDEPVTFATPDPQYSAISQLFATEAGYAVNGDRVITDTATARRISAELRATFTQQGGMTTGADTEFKTWVSAGDMYAAPGPAILTYENEFTADELKDKRDELQHKRTGSPLSKLIKPGMVLLYLTPEAFDVDTLIGVSTAGDAVGQAIEDDPAITSITEHEYAFIPPGTDPAGYAAYMKTQDVTVAGELPTMPDIPPDNVIAALLKDLP
jgi:hypothetical protein